MEVPDALAAVQIDRFFPSHALAPFVPEHGPTPGDELHPGLRALFDDADAGLPVDSHIDVAREGGSTVPARVTVTPYQDSDGSRHGYLLVITDETRAVEVARMKDEFVGMISHELRTPLSAIIGFLDLLQNCLLYTSPSPRDQRGSRMPSSA